MSLKFGSLAVTYNNSLYYMPRTENDNNASDNNTVDNN